VIPGASASFSVVLADTGGVSYQWYFVGTAIPGATSDALLLANVSSSNEGVYWVAVSNAVGSTASTLANLYIDSRGCGMPDSWQLQYFGNLLQNPLGDYDGDGISNLQEFLDGTNPTNAASALYRITLVSDGGMVVVSPNQSTYTSGQVVTLTATGSDSMPFHAWTGDVVTRSNSITVAMTNNLTLFAHFLPLTLVWTNVADGDWNVAANWSPNLSPISNESVLIGYGYPAAALPTITQNSNVDLVDFTFGNRAWIPTLTGSGRITISGTGIWNSGTMGGTGAIVVEPGASFTLANSSGLVLSRTLENAGSAAWVGGNILLLGGVITNDAGAQFTFAGPASISGAQRFDNAGTLNLANGATSFAGVAFDDYGTVNFPGGTFTLSGGGVLASSLVVPAGSSINLEEGIFTSTTNLSLTGGGTLFVSSSSLTLSGFVNITGSNIFSSGSIELNGNYVCTNNTLIIGGVVNFDGTSLVSPLVIDLSNGSLGGSNDVTIGSAMTWTGGGMSGTGRTFIPPGVTLTISNPSFITLTSRTLDNAGTVTWSGAGLTMTDGVITNEPGAVFEVQSPTAIFGGGFPRFDNAGTFNTPVSGTTTLGAALNNYNTLAIQGGTLVLQGGGNNTGTISVPAGTTINFGGGTFISSGASTISGGGTLIVSGGTPTLGGVVNLTGSNIFSGGSTELNGYYVCTNNALTISGGSVNFDGTGPVSPSVINLSRGSLGGSDLVTAGSAMTWSGGAMSGTGRTVIPAGATLTINNPSFITLTARTLDNAGTTTWSGANLNMDDGVITNEPGALFQVSSPTSIFPAGGAPRFDNAGTLTTPAGGTTTFDVALNNLNTLAILGGTLLLEGGGLNTGSISVPAGAAISLSLLTFSSSPGSAITGGGTLIVSGGTPTLSGVVNLAGSNIFSGGSTELNGFYVCTNNALTICGGSVNFDGTGSVSPSVINLSSGTLGGRNLVTVGSAMTWTGGGMSGTGRTVIPAGATLSINNPSFITLTSRTLDNGGVTTWTGAGSLTMNGSVITNRFGALFNPQNASLLVSGGGSPRFDNAGTFRKTASAGTLTLVSIPFTNYGVVDLQQGVLSASGGGYASASNAVLNCGLAGPVPGTNYGQLQVSGGVNLNGALSVNFTNNYIPTTNDLFTLVLAGARNGAFSSFLFPSNQVGMVLSNTPTSVIVRAANILALPQPLLLPPQFSGSNVILTWASVPNGVYRLQFNPDLSPSNWNAVAGDVTAQSNIASKTDALTSSNRYYRVLSLPP
jgi:hypothetical protein